MYSSVAVLAASLFRYCSWVAWDSANLGRSPVLYLLLGGTWSHLKVVYYFLFNLRSCNILSA